MSAASPPVRLVSVPDAPIARLLIEKRVIVCCGAGGVGKTTTSAALGIAAARMGRRVLVLTVDPSKRLAETLGVARNPPAPVPIPDDRIRAAGIEAPGGLDAWMLDPKIVADEAVRRFARDDAEARAAMDNRIYQHVTALVAGLHEYAAMDALHRHSTSGQYDLVVVDTPPSRNALDFLEAPQRLARFLEGTIFRVFLPKRGGLFARATSKMVSAVLRGVFGERFAGELMVFLNAFSGMFSALSGELGAMQKMLGDARSAFLLVTSPTASALAEAGFFREKIRQLKLPFHGFILNRSEARDDGKIFPHATLLGANPSAEALTAMEKLQGFAKIEQLRAVRDRGILADLALSAGGSAVAIALPTLTDGSDEMATLTEIADILASERRAGPRA